MSIYIRPRSKGSAFELRVKHKRLARPAYATLGSREAAEALGHRTLAALERGEMPDWLKEPVRRECDTIADLIRAYRGIIAVPPSTQEVLDAIIAEVGTVNLSEVSVLWAEGWIRSLKQERHLAPGTISKSKGGLSRVFPLGCGPSSTVPHQQSSGPTAPRILRLYRVRCGGAGRSRRGCPAGS
jgi:hypothetical protein